MARWIFALIGLIWGNFPGAIIGYFIGYYIDTLFAQTAKETINKQAPMTSRNGFLYNLVLLATAMMKADGKITKNELEYVKLFFRNNFGVEGERSALRIIKDMMHKNIDITATCLQIRLQMSGQLKSQLLYFLFGLAKVDQFISEAEISLLDRMAHLMGIDDMTYNSVKSMFYEAVDSSYSILGITKDATDEEVKKAYRTMARENHPDTVSYMGEDIRKAAEEKFRRINEAYEKIKKQRGMN